VSGSGGNSSIKSGTQPGDGCFPCTGDGKVTKIRKKRGGLKDLIGEYLEEKLRKKNLPILVRLLSSIEEREGKAERMYAGRVNLQGARSITKGMGCVNSSKRRGGTTSKN